jgi:hypothetical protein
VLTESASPLGYLLLRCLRAYLNTLILGGLTLHTAHTIEEGQESIREFDRMMQVCPVYVGLLIL